MPPRAKKVWEGNCPSGMSRRREIELQGPPSEAGDFLGGARLNCRCPKDPQQQKLYKRMQATASRAIYFLGLRRGGSGRRLASPPARHRKTTRRSSLLD